MPHHFTDDKTKECTCEVETLETGELLSGKINSRIQALSGFSKILQFPQNLNLYH